MIDKLIKELYIDDSFKSLLSTVIEGELFSILQLRNKPKISIQKYTQPNDNRVWCEVVLTFSEKEISLYQCRPFIDRGVRLKTIRGKIIMRKTYYLYDSPIHHEKTTI